VRATCGGEEEVLGLVKETLTLVVVERIAATAGRNYGTAAEQRRRDSDQEVAQGQELERRHGGEEKC
jgi:hypothetical protein